jgi:hypothetical protein
MVIFPYDLKLFLNNYLIGFWIFSFHILSHNNIGKKGAEEVPKSITSLANCPLTYFCLDLS